jgi:hypothetical protein
LYALAEALKIEDAKQTPTAGPLLEEHVVACEAIEAMKKLGSRVLVTANRSAGVTYLLKSARLESPLQFSLLSH